MKTKQIISIVITGVVIIAVGITGVASNVIGSKLIKQNKTETSSIVKDMFSSVSGDSNIELPNKDFVGVINIEGEIGASSSNSLTSDSTYNHDFYLKYIEKMEKLSEDVFAGNNIEYLNISDDSNFVDDEIFWEQDWIF